MDDLDLLMREVRRYLRAVDVFRAEGCEPSWLPEQTLPPGAPPPRPLPASAQLLARLDPG
jgi:hypothetical protein